MQRDPDPKPVMTFPTLDEAESALDWIGLELGEGSAGDEGWFEGELDPDAVELLDAACADAETPPAVRELAEALLERWRDEAAPRAWRVTFPA
jgi:hypothetical protein